MRPLPSKRCIHARRSAEARALEREYEAQARDLDYYYLEPDKRLPFDPSVRHVVTLETRAAPPDARVTCTCGGDTGWIAFWDAELRAHWHRRQAETATSPGSDRVGDREERARGEGASTSSRTLFQSLARRANREIIRTPPVVPLPIINGQQPLLLVFDPSDLAIEMAFERTPEAGGTRVRQVPHVGTDYWIPRMTPVFAVSEGAIVYARRLRDGHTVVIDHCNGWVSVYHRLEYMFLAPSERVPGKEIRVAAGDVLGYLEASRAGPPKPLKFELWRSDHSDSYEQMDPLRYIRRWRHISWSDRSTSRSRAP